MFCIPHIPSASGGLLYACEARTVDLHLPKRTFQQFVPGSLDLANMLLVLL